MAAEELSYQLEGLPNRAQCIAAVWACLQTAIGGDQLGWAGIDLSARSSEYRTDPPVTVAERDLADQWLTEIPTIKHYSVHPEDAQPHRISDLTPPRLWASTPVYRELFRELGYRHQLVIPAAGRTHTQGSGWYLNRAGRDFSDGDLHVARSLRPVLRVLELAYPPPGPSGPGADLREEARVRAGLTPRELDVLSLLADGLTARQIATLRRISPRTVGKHLQHLYEKLNCHDRLQAVNKARTQGLL